MFAAPASITLDGSIDQPANYAYRSRAIVLSRLKPLLISSGRSWEHLSSGEKYAERPRAGRKKVRRGDSSFFGHPLMNLTGN